MSTRKHLLCFVFWLGAATQAAAQDHLDQLLKNLEGIACPLDYAVLSTLSQTHDYRTRTEALLKILDEREAIHARSDMDAFQKTQIVCNALRLLDEYDLPDVKEIFRRLGQEQNWEEREKVLLAYLAAKRDLNYAVNLSELFASLAGLSAALGNPANENVVWTIADICSTLDYLGDLFIRTGDIRILEELFAYASKASGYPAEHFSDRLVAMFLKRPDLFVSSLAGTAEATMRVVTNDLVFGVRNDSIREKVEAQLPKRLGRAGPGEKELIAGLTAKLEVLRQQWSREAGVAAPMPSAAEKP